MGVGLPTPWERSRVSSNSESDHRTQRVSPSFAGRRPASALASAIKRRNRKVGTRAELALRHALWPLGLRYRLNYKGLPGTPDLVFSRQRVVVFVDGDFWHGRDWEQRENRLQAGMNATYWLAKIAYNRERDRRNDALLAGLGWKVVRLWETDVLRDPEGAANGILGLMVS